MNSRIAAVPFTLRNLKERREDRSRRTANRAGYAYYTRFTRARYGTKHCANDWLPAERLEQTVTRRVPAVRIESGYMEPAGLEPATSCLQSRRSPS
jgi:hypothetical protein